MSSGGPRLVLFLADGTTLDIPLDGERLTVGRRPGNDVCLPYPAVSGAHAAFLTTPDGVVVEDLGSTNGTQVNGQRVTRQLLADGDRIELGRQRLVYVADPDAVAAAPLAGEPPPAAPAEGADAALDPLLDSLLGLPGAAVLAAVPAPVPAPGGAAGGTVLRVVTGPNAGRALALTGPEALVGRVGRQVVALRRVDGGMWLQLAEGEGVPRVNDVPVPAEGVLLQPGDAIDVAGARLEYVEVTPQSEGSAPA